MEVALVVGGARARRGSRRAPRARTAASPTTRAARPSARRSARRPAGAARPARPQRDGADRERVLLRLDDLGGAAGVRGRARTPTRRRGARSASSPSPDEMDGIRMKSKSSSSSSAVVRGQVGNLRLRAARRPAPMDPQTIPDTAVRRRRRSRARRAAARRRRERPRPPAAARPRAPPCARRSRCCRCWSPRCDALRADTDRPRAWRSWSRTTTRRASWPRRSSRSCPTRRSATCPHRGAPTARRSTPPPHLVGERAPGARRARRRRPRRRLGRGAGRARRRRATRAPRRCASGVGDPLERDDLIAALVESGYERVGGTVEERGQVSARGDLVDVLPDHRPRAAARSSSSATRSSACRRSRSFTQRSLRDLGTSPIYPAQRAARRRRRACVRRRRRRRRDARRPRLAGCPS